MWTLKEQHFLATNSGHSVDAKPLHQLIYKRCQTLLRVSINGSKILTSSCVDGMSKVCARSLSVATLTVGGQARRQCVLPYTRTPDALSPATCNLPSPSASLLPLPNQPCQPSPDFSNASSRVFRTSLLRFVRPGSVSKNSRLDATRTRYTGARSLYARKPNPMYKPHRIPCHEAAARQPRRSGRDRLEKTRGWKQAEVGW